VRLYGSSECIRVRRCRRERSERMRSPTLGAIRFLKEVCFQENNLESIKGGRTREGIKPQCGFMVRTSVNE
jgi:hypothetical protein